MEVSGQNHAPVALSARKSVHTDRMEVWMSPKGRVPAMVGENEGFATMGMEPEPSSS